MVKKFGVLAFQPSGYRRILMLALFSLFYRNGDRRGTHSGKDASLPGKSRSEPLFSP
jgi:hypothetical protein